MLASDLTSEDWARQASSEGGNTAHWILGHLAAARRVLARRVGADVSNEPWEEAFGRNAKPDGTGGYPAPSILLEDMKTIGAALEQRLSGMDEAAGNEEWLEKFPDGSRTVAGGAHFLYFHEVYHIGQLGLMRRIAGKPGIA